MSAARSEHFPWWYTEFGVMCACGKPMNATEECPDESPADRQGKP